MTEFISKKLSTDFSIPHHISPHLLPRRGLMLVLSSPSGAGKSSIARDILAADAEITMSISVTTRRKRPAEQEGVDYHFITTEQFQEMVACEELLEHAHVFDHYYGTPRTKVETLLARGHDVLFDIDWQGTQQLRQHAREDVISIFILPPSYVELNRRLHARGQDNVETVRRRMARAADEMSHWAEYDYIIINETLSISVEQVQKILEAERLRRERRVGLAQFIRQLQQAE